MTGAAVPTLEEARAHADATVRRSGTSFATGMRILGKARREAMHAIYAFSREVDDIADDDSPVVEKRLALAAWRAEIGRLYDGAPTTPTGVALLEPVHRFNLPKEEFLMLIEGMEMDAEGPIVAPTFERLFAYTRRVAGAVGLLSMPVFGAPKTKAADRFALALADALQLTNILRDVDEDAAIGRLYLPREILEKHSAPLDPKVIADAPGLPGVAEDLAAIAKERFATARASLKALDWRILRPALLMMGVYEAYLKKLEARGWDRIGEPVSISKFEKTMVAGRYFFAPPLNAAP
ncbi:MAG: presqualene diphosphate synthase HpnD [Parvularculaceae bacterium]